MTKETVQLATNPIHRQLDSIVETGKIIISSLLLKAEKMSLEARWQLGALLANNDAIIKTKAEMRYLGSHWGIWESELYRMRALRHLYPTIERLQSACHSLESQGKHPTWHYFRSNVLPAEHHRPLEFGGEDEAISSTLSRIEHHASEAAKLSVEILSQYDKLNKPLQEEVEGSLLSVSSSLDETRRITSSLAKQQPDRYLKHLAEVRKLPCCVCGVVGKSQAHHVMTSGMAQKTSDYLTIPLCPFHHQNYNQWGKSKWEDKYGLQINMTIQTLSLIYGIPEEALYACICDLFPNFNPFGEPPNEPQTPIL